MNRYAPLALLAGAIASIAACSAAEDVVLGKGELSGGGGQPFPVSMGGAPSAGGRAASGGDPLVVWPQNTGGSGATTGCSVIASRAEVLQSDVYVMFDQSSSMNAELPAPATGRWWTAAQQAFEAFVNEPTHYGVGVGVQFFPLGAGAPESCTADYATPEVPVRALPGNAAELIAAVEAHQPAASTPTAPALAGAITHMKARALDHPGRPQSVLFLTDGFPTECEPQDVAGVAEIAHSGYESEPSVRTFVIGLNLGADAENLNAIAEAGGTVVAISIDGGTDVAGALRRAMGASVLAPMACRIDLPKENGAGAPLNPDQLDVRYTPPGGPPRDLGRVGAEADCSQPGGWYYETLVNTNVGGTTTIVLCPQTCADIQPGLLELLFGCNV